MELKHYHVKSLFEAHHLANRVEDIENYLNEEARKGYELEAWESDRDYPTIITSKDISEDDNKNNKES